MQITTIFGISIAFATGILVGWTVNSVSNQVSPSQTMLQQQYHLPIQITTTSEAVQSTITHPSQDTDLSSTKENVNNQTFAAEKFFSKKDETDRLIRLAAKNVIEDPQRSRSYLYEALQIDPNNSDLHTFKASLEETLYQDQIANYDYIAAIQYDPENPYRREQLADFYLRTKQYPLALEVLQDTMTAPSLDSIWLKAIFWGHLASPIKDSWHRQDVPEGRLKDFISYLLALPHGVYWDQHAFEALPAHQFYYNTLQETFWLHLISLLKNHEEEKALSLLENNTFQYASWAPELEKSLRALLNYRLLNKENPTLSSIFPAEDSIENPRQLLKLLANLSDTERDQLPSAIPYQLQSFLLSKEAFVIPFLAEEWNEAAIQLHFLTKYPDDFPIWISSAMATALDQNRDSKTALSFAMAQNPSSSLTLLIAEIALAQQEKQIAFNALKQIYTSNDENGKKAALILAQFLLDHENLTDAKKALLAQPSLSNNIKAREILARIALQEGNAIKATQIYTSIEKHSSEAKSYLAHKAFIEREWPRARELTEELLKDHPENPILAENFKRIVAEEKKKKNH
jgi:predicted Zn-dependent protease